jgi:hypothetical protein
MMIRLAVPVSFGLAAVAGCAIDPATEPMLRCNVAFCGGNSPIVGHYGIDDQLNLDFQPNKDGFTILGMTKDYDVYQLEVLESRIIAHDQYGNKLTGTDLIGMKIWLDRNGVEQFGISIEGVDTAHEVVAPYGDVETYLLDWGTLAGPLLPGPVQPGDTIEVPGFAYGGPVCPPPVFEKWQETTSSGGADSWDELTRSGIHFYDAIFFEGDRIDMDALTIDPAPDDRWFNIGCGAHTLAKMRLTRSTIHFAKGWPYVQATLKMLTGDYCGTGSALTVHGEPLVWTNYDAMDRFFAPPRSLEARWSPDGAICLGEPRLYQTQSELGHKYFPDIYQAIVDECATQWRPAPPPCNDGDPHKRAEPDELVTSANYD